MKITKKSALLSASGSLVLLGIVGVALANDEAEKPVGVPAATLTAAIQAASATKAGDISEVEVESENGVTSIEVEVLSADGAYEVKVNAATGKVTSVEKDDENENNADDKDN